MFIQVKIYWITGYSFNLFSSHLKNENELATGYSFHIFSSLLKNEGKRKGEWISKTGFKQEFLVIHSIFTFILSKFFRAILNLSVIFLELFILYKENRF